MEKEKFLPIANVVKVTRSALPENSKVSKDAKITIQECVSEFISFLTSEGIF